MSESRFLCEGDVVSLNPRNSFAPSRQQVRLRGRKTMVDSRIDGTIVSAPYTAIHEHAQGGWLPHE